MTGEDRVHDLRHDRVLVPDDAGKKRRAVAQSRDEVLAEFVLHRPEDAIGRSERRTAQGAERARLFRHGRILQEVVRRRCHPATGSWSLPSGSGEGQGGPRPWPVRRADHG
jgi:hypothetical protein